MLPAEVRQQDAIEAGQRFEIAWLSAHEGDFVVDSIVLGEVCLGILALPAGRKQCTPPKGRWKKQGQRGLRFGP